MADMLPLPSSTRRDKRFERLSGTGVSNAYAPIPLSSGRVMTVLRTRSRLTNLAVVILLGVLSVSLLGNLSHLVGEEERPLSRWHAAWDELASEEVLESGRPPSVETTIHRDARMADVDHLVLVPGHAVWTGYDPSIVEDDTEWVLQDFQKGGSIKTFIKHIQQGTDMLASDPRTLLVFSGGATRPDLSSPLSEGSSYHRLAAARGLLPSDQGTATTLPPSARAVTEEYALDSYENLLFSMARFREVTGHWPAHITVVGYGMKQRRFEQLHRGAIRYPADRFKYIGIDDEGNTDEHYTGELKHGYAPFLFSPSGCRPPLSYKRASRNPFARYPPYHSSAPDLVPLLEWCPPSKPVGDVAVPHSLHGEDGMEPPAGFVVYDGELPWDGLGKVDRERD